MNRIINFLCAFGSRGNLIYSYYFSFSKNSAKLKFVPKNPVQFFQSVDLYCGRSGIFSRILALTIHIWYQIIRTINVYHVPFYEYYTAKNDGNMGRKG